MGVKLSGIPWSPPRDEDLRGKVVAIDAPNLIYAFYAVQLLRTEATPAQREAALRAGTRGLVQRMADLHVRGARCVVVFDGEPHPLKRALLDARDLVRSVPAIRREDYAVAKSAARALGAPVIEAPHDAEAQATRMARAGLVDVVATTDWDALAMGAPTLLRNLSASPLNDTGRRWSLVRQEDALGHLRLGHTALRIACVLMGCDYFPGIDRVGPHRAMKLAREHGTLDAALDALGVHDARREACQSALALFDEPPGREVPTLRWGAVDHDALQKALAGVVAGRKRVQTKLG